MNGYTKLFNSIVTSTIWTEDDKTRIVWITMLAIADKNGEVQGSIPGLARIAGVAVDDCRIAIGKFLSPDLDSRTKDDEGRRIEEIDDTESPVSDQPSWHCFGCSFPPLSDGDIGPAHTCGKERL